MNYADWKLTAEEEEECHRKGCSIGELQEAKKRAYIENGGIILNPGALADMYEALKGIRDEGTRACQNLEYPLRDTYNIDLVDRLARHALAKAEK